MKCPACGYNKDRVIDSRPSDDAKSIKRRRVCLACQKRFTTLETIEYAPIIIVKKDGTREIFDRSKLLAGILKACYKRPITTEQLDAMVSDIECELQNSLNSEISSKHIGVLVMEKLKKLDAVAYVRFASVYREFMDLDTFMHELEEFKSENSGN